MDEGAHMTFLHLYHSDRHDVGLAQAGHESLEITAP